MTSRTGSWIALVVAGVIAFGTPHEVRAASPPGSEVKTPSGEAGDFGAENERVQEPDDDREVRVAEASRHYRDGQELFEQEQYAQAAEAFERSFAAIPTPNTLYNIAVSHELAEHPIPAILAYEQYLSGDDVPAQERDEIKAAIGRLRARVGELEIAEGVNFAKVRIDGETIETFPHLVMPGKVTVEIFGARQGERLERTYDIRPGDRRTIDAAFPVPTPEPVPRPAVEDDPPERPPPIDRTAERRRETVKKVFWGGVALTAASGVAIAVLGGLERREERLFEQDKCGKECPEDEDGNPSKPYPFAHEDRIEAYQLATNVMIGVASALAVATLALGLRAYRRDSGSGRRARAKSVRLLGSSLVVRW